MEKNLKQKFGQRIKTLRKQLRMSQKEFAAAMEYFCCQAKFPSW